MHQGTYECACALQDAVLKFVTEALLASCRCVSLALLTAKTTESFVADRSAQCELLLETAANRAGDIAIE